MVNAPLSLNWMRRASPRFQARMVAVGDLILLVTGFALCRVLPRLVVKTHAAATAANVLAHRDLFLAGFAGALVGVASYLMVTALLYRLFEPVNRTLSLSAAFFSLTGCIVQGLGLLFRYAPLLLLEDRPYLRAFLPEQRQALALLSFHAYAQAYNISLVFFAFYLLQIGYLVFRSTFLPRWLGVLVALGGGGLVFLVPPAAAALMPYVMLSTAGELLLVLWLVVEGVGAARCSDR